MMYRNVGVTQTCFFNTERTLSSNIDPVIATDYCSWCLTDMSNSHIDNGACGGVQLYDSGPIFKGVMCKIADFFILVPGSNTNAIVL